MDEMEKARNFIAHNRMLLPSEFQRLYMYINDWNRVIGLWFRYRSWVTTLSLSKPTLLLHLTWWPEWLVSPSNPQSSPPHVWWTLSKLSQSGAFLLVVACVPYSEPPKFEWTNQPLIKKHNNCKLLLTLYYKDANNMFYYSSLSKEQQWELLNITRPLRPSPS